jgi:hypothetical protein
VSQVRPGPYDDWPDYARYRLTSRVQGKIDSRVVTQLQRQPEDWPRFWSRSMETPPSHAPQMEAIFIFVLIIGFLLFIYLSAVAPLLGLTVGLGGLLLCQLVGYIALMDPTPAGHHDLYDLGIILGKLLPPRMRDNVFIPSLQDLVALYCRHLQGLNGSKADFGLRTRYIIRVMLLIPDAVRAVTCDYFRHRFWWFRDRLQVLRDHFRL